MDVGRATGALAALLLVARTADAAEPASGETPSDTTLARIIDRPHTVAYLEVGGIALPTAPIVQQDQSGKPAILRGDVAIQTGLHILYRWNRSFAVGAGAIFAPSPLASNKGYGGQSSLPRTHSRTYLFLGGEGRYIPLHTGFFEAWVGLSAGAIIVADRFTTDAGDAVPEILGTKEVTIRTEGFAFGVQGGGSYYLTENWIAGLDLRAYGWVLPDTPRCSGIGDCASLSGTVEAFELGLTIGYRLPL
jgi:hypothetical protein